MTRAFGKIYQDDGESTAYLDGHFSNTFVEAAPLDQGRSKIIPKQNVQIWCYYNCLEKYFNLVFNLRVYQKKNAPVLLVELFFLRFLSPIPL